jgi:BirA family transcriptional regulator, biotin operon repressor / biotin---[acetyl-CoA-carboxylase] ligase
VSALGHPRLHLRRTGSTNDRARALAIAGAPHGTLVTADEQTAGRGRHGRSWSAPPGSSVLMSLIVRADPPPRLLPLIAAIAVCEVAGDDALIKWPNDVVVTLPPAPSAGASGSLAKLAGILIEGRPQEGWAVVGIGLNVAVRLDQLPPELRPDRPDRPDRPEGEVTSSRPAATLGLPREAVEPTLAGLLVALEGRLLQAPEATLEAWRSRDALRGREIAWGTQSAGGPARRGRAEGIDGDGRLIVELAEGGRTTLSAGEVHLAAVG